MKAFISYHRFDSKYRHKLENIFISHQIDYYAVPENKVFDGEKAETIKNYICRKLQKCDVLVCLIGQETYSRPHVDREIHTALKGEPGKRLGIIGVILPTRNETLKSINPDTFPTKLWDNKDYVVWTEWNRLNSAIVDLIQQALLNSSDNRIQTNHSNPCMQLRNKKYYEN